MTREIDTGTQELLCSVTDHVATITFNRPEKRNALGDEMTPAFREMLLTVEADNDVRVVVVTGAGKGFCAGGDVSSMGSRIGSASKLTVDEKIRVLQHAQETCSLRLHEMAKPTIAALPCSNSWCNALICGGNANCRPPKLAVAGSSGRSALCVRVEPPGRPA